jgi:hypothetical protein
VQKFVAPMNKNIIPETPAVELVNPVTANNKSSTTPMVIKTLRAIVLLDILFPIFILSHF